MSTTLTLDPPASGVITIHLMTPDVLAVLGAVAASLGGPLPSDAVLLLRGGVVVAIPFAQFIAALGGGVATNHILTRSGNRILLRSGAYLAHR